MRHADGLRLDFSTGTLHVADTPFRVWLPLVDDPKCDPDARCTSCAPFGACAVGGPEYMTDPGWDRGWQLWAQLDNGILASIEVDEAGAIELRLCSQTLLITDDVHTPWPMMVIGRLLVPAFSCSGRPLGHGISSWRECEAEWLAEHLSRVGRFKVEQPRRGARARLVSVRDVRVRPRGTVLA